VPSPYSGITIKDQRTATGLHGAVLVARRDEPLQSDATDLGNVIPFVRPHRHGATAPFPLPSVAASERPAPHGAKFGFGRGIALLVGSLALHSTLLALFWHQPRPMASIGIEVMSVEIVLGATTAAGLAPTPGEQEAQAAASSEQPKQDEPVTEQPSRAATVMPQEVPVALQETAPEVKPQEQQPETAAAETPAATQPAEQPHPQVQAVQQATERKRIEAPTDKNAVQKKQEATDTAIDAARGVGYGRSDRTSTYEGMVAAHIMRHNQAPAAVRRAAMARGVTSDFAVTLEYEIDGYGHVTSTKVIVSSGNQAIDQAVIAVVQKASPVPRPPDGKPRRFSQRLAYNERLLHRR
jgi:protein TonB